MEASPLVTAVIETTRAYALAMVANAAPVMVKPVIDKFGRHRVDFGKKAWDGRDIFGRNKSWEGIVAAIVMSVLASTIFIYFEKNPWWVAYGFISAVGAMCGDLLNSFMKRRLSLGPGECFIPCDQLSFLLVAHMFLYLSGVYAFVGVELSARVLAFGVVASLFLHLLTNLFAYALGLKDVPC